MLVEPQCEAGAFLCGENWLGSRNLCQMVGGEDVVDCLVLVIRAGTSSE